MNLRRKCGKRITSTGKFLYTKEQMALILEAAQDHTPRGERMPIATHALRDLKTKDIFMNITTFWTILNDPEAYTLPDGYGADK